MKKRIKHSETGSALGFLGLGYGKIACIPDYDAGKPEKTPSGKRTIIWVTKQFRTRLGPMHSA